ncbi:MAG TPA: cell division/cell wall cluster transcriptional repressor MraZ [Clostridia bacterium]|nr:cell division/cell wall cluster transcriptional repressor MraZ [Clostridia bacterium]
MDDKGRVILPVSMREVLGDKFVIAKSVDSTLKILYLYTRKDWENIIEAAAKIAARDRHKAVYVRLLSASGKDTELDSQNRVLIPIELRNYANLGKEAVLLGYNNRVEIWNKESYHAAHPDDSEISEQVALENADNVAAILEEIPLA